MVYQMLRIKKHHGPSEPLAVILSPRPVYFKAVPYGIKYHELLDSLNKACATEPRYKPFPTGVRRLIMALNDETIRRSSWIRKLSAEDQAWFYADPDFFDPAVIEDTLLYMVTSAIRLISYLDQHSVDRDSYRLFWDEKSYSSGVAQDSVGHVLRVPQSWYSIQVGMRHAYHVPDFTFDFDQALASRYRTLLEQITVKGEVLSDELRFETRKLCHEYYEQKHSTLRLDTRNLLHELDDLMWANQKAGTATRIFVGGPFTEALKCCRNLHVESIVGMGGFIDGSHNLFPNQFNFHVDMHAAREILHLAETGAMPLTLLPTECVKGSPYSLSWKEVEACFAHSPASLRLFEQYYFEPTSPAARYAPFDWVLALTVSHPHLFTQRRVRVAGHDPISFQPDPAGRINMFWNDREHMLSHREEFLATLKSAFERDPEAA